MCFLELSFSFPDYSIPAMGEQSGIRLLMEQRGHKYYDRFMEAYNNDSTGNDILAIVACRVFESDIHAILDEGDISAELTYLEGGLHSSPSKLRLMLQKEIDRISAEGRAGRIALAYGMCGRGIIGLRARSIPLLIPKVHDCISLYLGSDRRYREEFEKEPGTFYITWGWYNEGMTPFGAARNGFIDENDRLRSESYDYYRDRYGDQNAGAIVSFYNSWQKNYRRTVFIDTGVGDPATCEAYAADLAGEFGWEYRKMSGSRRYLEKLFRSRKGNDEVLLVPPHAVTVFDPKGKGAASAFSGKQKPEAGAETEKETEEPGEHVFDGRGIRYGLGIDAGGTYTDAVIYDFDEQKVIASGKGRTTVDDYTVGIAEAVEKIDPALLRKVELVSVSTTLATNAIVEGRGRKVGLLLMHAGTFDGERIGSRPYARIGGAFDIDGRESEPVDGEEVRKIAAHMVKMEGVEAFAVSGYAGSVNPAHELTVKRLIQEETGLHVCCGHELSDLYNFYLRANTAVLNARIIPLLEAFLTDIDRYLETSGIDAPVMVVRGDGSLMSSRLAKEIPIETSLSGPAASVAGARYLTGFRDATVIDVGGTTSDIGRISGGFVELCGRGAQVGAWRTHVKALDMSTLGMGGDSEIVHEKRLFTVGPRRVLPVCRLAADYPGAVDFEGIHRLMDDLSTSTRALSWYYPANHIIGEAELSDRERSIMDILREGPKTIFDIAALLDAGHWQMVDMQGLENRGHVHRSGLTPTDLLHVSGELDLWDADASRSLARIYSAITGMAEEEMVTHLFDRISRTLLQELILKQLPEGDGVDRKNPPEILGHLIRGGVPSLSLGMRFEHPVIGLGAPVRFFTRKLKESAELELVVPEFAEVANAVGAITSPVTVTCSVTILSTPEGGFGVRGLKDAADFDTFEEAAAYAESAIRREVAERALAAGTLERSIELERHDLVTEAADGSELFLERSLKATISGSPDHPGGEGLNK
jgi:N-methylhydantoinase A/oxoprolinase/acetone carboxylase beta subunit